MEEVITPGSKGVDGSAPIHNDQTHDTLLPHLAFRARTWSQNTGNIKDKTTTFLNSAVSTGSSRGWGGLLFRDMPPPYPSATKRTSGQRLHRSIGFKPVLSLPARWGC